MENNEQLLTSDKPTETLETELKKFANELGSYWAKFIAGKILSGNSMSDDDITTAYSYLLEELGLKEKSNRTEIIISYNDNNDRNYKPDLLFTKLDNVEGVNGLIENQIIEFSPNMTIIYGANGSGKSGYTRLLKDVFYSKSPEKILPNIYLDGNTKPINARFTFKSNDLDIPLMFADKNNSEFKQFSVFDGKSVIIHLKDKNEFEFKPAGLSFFADFIIAVNNVEKKLLSDLSEKKTGNTALDLADLFGGESEIKTLVQVLDANTKMEDIQQFIPFTENDAAQKQELNKIYDDLRLQLIHKDKEIKKLENIDKLLSNTKAEIEKLNGYFTTQSLTKIKNAISDCLYKESLSKSEGIERFKTDKILGIGTDEWMNFIKSAEVFSNNQKIENIVYPNNGSNCLLCQQPLSEDAQKLIADYWIFIKSIAEVNAKEAQEKLNKMVNILEKLNFDIFPNDNILTIWITDNFPQELEDFQQALSAQKELCEKIISDVQNKIIVDRVSIQTTLTNFSSIDAFIVATIKSFQEDEQSKQLDKLLKSKIFLEHKEKFNVHFLKIETYINNHKWIAKAKLANFTKYKTRITNEEKKLSDKYFSQKYIDTFNEECQKLNGNFGIEINHTGSAGKSFKQLKLKGTNPNTILSEGEQRAIAIADFLAEMKFSEINRGIIFDDPVTSLDETRKSIIAERLAEECILKQTIVFTHDLVFVSSLIGHCSDRSQKPACHWIENIGGNKAGKISLDNTPSHEKEYRSAEPAKKLCAKAKKDDCLPMEKERLIKSGFTSLRTSYEVLVIHELFNDVVQRFSERISIEALSKVNFNSQIIKELLDSYKKCCRYMEGHTHSDNFASYKPEPQDLDNEIKCYEAIRKKIRDAKDNNK